MVFSGLTLFKLYCLHFATINRYANLAISCVSLAYSDTKEKPDDSQAGSGVIGRVVSSVIFTWIYVHLFRSTWVLVIVSWESVGLNLKTCMLFQCVQIRLN